MILCCGLKFEMTCPAFPEQYDVYKGDEYVAYVRLRWGELTVHPVLNGEIEFTKEICSFDFDDLNGMFKNETERKQHLILCATKIIEWLLNGRSDEVLQKSEPSVRDKILEQMIDDMITSKKQNWKPLKFTIKPPHAEFMIFRGKQNKKEKRNDTSRKR